MGITSLNQDFQIGEIQFNNENDKTAIIPCLFYSETKCHIIVHDKKGRSCQSQFIDTDESTSEIKLDVSNCKGGVYHAWIYADDKVTVRRFVVESSGKNGGMINKIMDFFN